MAKKKKTPTVVKCGAKDEFEQPEEWDCAKIDAKIPTHVCKQKITSGWAVGRWILGNVTGSRLGDIKIQNSTDKTVCGDLKDIRKKSIGYELTESVQQTTKEIQGLLS